MSNGFFCFFFPPEAFHAEVIVRLPRFRLEHSLITSGLLADSLCNTAPCCPPPRRRLQGNEAQSIHFLIAPTSLDPPLVGSHDYATVSRLTPALDGLISAELEFPAPSTVYSGGKRWSNV